MWHDWHLCIPHLLLLLVEYRGRLATAMISLGLFPPVLDFLTNNVIFAFGLLEVRVHAVPFFLQPGCIVDMMFPELIAAGCQSLEWFDNILGERIRKAVVFGSARFEGSELYGPCGHGSAVAISLGPVSWA